MTRRPKILGISGSIRKNAFNTIILESLAEEVKDYADFSIFPLNDIPLYNQDEDTENVPVSVGALRAAIDGADGVVFASPEYNYGISGVLKNALDWASRPYGQSTLIGKPVLTITSSPAFTGGARAQSQLNEVLSIAIGARLLQRPQSIIPAVHEKIVDGRFTDETTLQFLKDGIDHLVKEAQLLKQIA